MRRGRIVNTTRTRTRNVIWKARCGACGHEEMKAVSNVLALGTADNYFISAGWRYFSRFGWACPGCTEFLRSAGES